MGNGTSLFEGDKCEFSPVNIRIGVGTDIITGFAAVLNVTGLITCVETVNRWRGQAAKKQSAGTKGTIMATDQRSPDIFKQTTKDILDLFARFGYGEHSEAVIQGLEQILFYYSRQLTEIPGELACPKCAFRLHKRILHAETGNVYINADSISEPCPNCGLMMRQLTWEEDGKETALVLLDTVRQLHSAQERLDELEQVN